MEYLHNMLRIGLTGGIGSGKSTVANLFAQYNIEIIDADIIAHQITQPHTPALQHIIEHFGSDILNQNHSGELDRKKLRHLVFNNEKERLWLENFLHPLIRQEIKRQIMAAKSPYCIVVIPLLAEAKGIDFIDRVLLVDASEALQLERAKKRDAAKDDIIKNIINSQSDREKRRKIANDIINNDGDISALHDSVAALHEQYLKLAEI